LFSHLIGAFLACFGVAWVCQRQLGFLVMIDNAVYDQKIYWFYVSVNRIFNFVTITSQSLCLLIYRSQFRLLTNESELHC